MKSVLLWLGSRATWLPEVLPNLLNNFVIHTHTYIHINLYRMRCIYVLTKLDERNLQLIFYISNLFYTTWLLQSQWLQTCTRMCIWVQPKKTTKNQTKPNQKSKKKSADEALEVEAQWRNKPRRGLCEGQWPKRNACISCCVRDEAMSWLKNEIKQ